MSLSPGKASCDRDALPNLRYMLHNPLTIWCATMSHINARERERERERQREREREKERERERAKERERAINNSMH